MGVSALGLACVSVLALAGACGHPTPAPTPALPHTSLSRLPPPAVIDPARPGAAYLTSVALQLQPGWGQFLDDCRIRLPAEHPLNQMTLAATAELTLDRSGKVIAVALVERSGNADFDRAVTDAIADATVLPVPPLEALSDDDRVYVRWLFARDRRQAGPATARLEHRELPLSEVIARREADGDLARAARRIATAPATAERDAAITAVATAALREALTSVDSSAQRAAIEAIGVARIAALASDVRRFLDNTSDDLRSTAVGAVGELGDRDAAGQLLVMLRRDLDEHRRLALAEAVVLVRIGQGGQAALVIANSFGTEANPLAIEAFAIAPFAPVVPQLGDWLHHGSAVTRSAVCAALAGDPTPTAIALVGHGLRDADASVRASCAAAAVGIATTSVARVAPLAGRLVTLQRDRDRAVRANAVAAVTLVDPAHLAKLVDDPAAEVRAAYAHALAVVAGDPLPALRALADDRDADVRAAAWHALTLRGGTDASPGLTDPASQVRLAAIAAARDDVGLRHVAISDDAPEVRTAALTELVRRAGRAAMAAMLLDQLAGAAPASADRVRSARAWLLAP